MSSRRYSRGSAAGNIITLLLLVGIVGARRLAVARQEGRAPEARGHTRRHRASRRQGRRPASRARRRRARRPIEPVTGTPTLEAANAFVPKDNILRIDISEYAGYGGLIVANGGLDPNAGFHLREGIRLPACRSR